MGHVKNITDYPKTYVFEDKPLFGLDIGHDMIRVMQFDPHQKGKLKLSGYGSIAFSPEAVADGVIVRPEIIAKAATVLFKKELNGEIQTKRVAISIPAARAYTRTVQLPVMGAKDLADAVLVEAEQNIPASIDDLYFDYTITRQNDDGMEVFLVAVPKKIIDSYLILTRMLGLEVVFIDTTIGASAHFFEHDQQSNVPSVLVDFGSETIDISVFNGGLVVTGSVAFGSDDFTKAISKHLNLTAHEALMLKGEYGLDKSAVQKQVRAALDPLLGQLIKEVRRTVRYYEQRYAKDQPIGQVITMGGGANMPGLADYLTEELRLPTRQLDTISHIDFGSLRRFFNADKMSFVTVAGLASIDPRRIFA